MKSKILKSGAVILILFLFMFLASSEKGIELAASSELKTGPAVRFEELKDAAVRDLQKLIRIKSVRDNELDAALFIKGILDREHIPSRIIRFPARPSHASLVAELPGKSETGGLILSGHLDVVEANPADWKIPPFEGRLQDGAVYGRGAVDMKGMLIMELYAFILAHRMKLPLEHKLMFLAVPGEEDRSDVGAQYLIAKHPEIFRGYEYVLNEGGIGTKDAPFPGAKIFNLQFAEKGILWLSIHAKGETGHGSTPPDRYASLDLIHFLGDMERLEKGNTITDETAAFFYQLGEAAGLPKSFILHRSRNILFRPILSGVISSSRHLRAMTSNTRSFTVLSTPGERGTNVITSHADAAIDMRLLPGTTPQAMLEKVRKLAEPYGIEVTPTIMTPATVSPLEGKLFKILGAVAQRAVPGSVVTPFLSPGTTDSTHFRNAGLKCYGLIPGLFSTGDLDGMHGRNERIEVENLVLGMKILYETIASMN